MLLGRLKEKAIYQRSPLFSGITCAFLNSTVPSQEKWWKNQWGADVPGSTDASKNYGKYVKRAQRAEAKRALKRLQGINKAPKKLFQGGVTGWEAWRKINQQTWQNANTWKNFNNEANSKPRTRVKSNANHSARSRERAKENKRKSKNKNTHFPWDDDPDEKVFEVKLGGRWFYWSFSKLDEFKNQKSWNWTRRRTYLENDESEDETLSIGSASDRVTLGLAPNGPLKLDDVKQAFRQCALKWHPDKNPGPSKVIAEENFKRCGAAYKALCDAFSVF
ncbi:hypothetical protein SUGI_1171310 [Cryptomeria japonica]|uniref:uncharacterized protein LOC131068311 n=1 Tax=Cryptomeria japonica TaxID=3369 RepID=UPI002414A5B3|nr:uncharacterized protein LOC131068311 [Cryptomeria japonica]GLJ54537.1 hypothetical protein SUGI_1171310 [Cryptomeria japonica]